MDGFLGHLLECFIECKRVELINSFIKMSINVFPYPSNFPNNKCGPMLFDCSPGLRLRLQMRIRIRIRKWKIFTIEFLHVIHKHEIFNVQESLSKLNKVIKAFFFCHRRKNDEQFEDLECITCNKLNEMNPERLQTAGNRIKRRAKR